MTAKSRIALVFVSLLLSAAPASAASWFELNFGLSGPRYDALVRSVTTRGARANQREVAQGRRCWNSNLVIGASSASASPLPPGSATFPPVL